MVKLRIEERLKELNKSKYWLCQEMDITTKNLNRIIRGETKSISFKYIQRFCEILKCTPGELIIIID